MPLLEQSALREVHSLILDLKDEIIGRLLKNDKLTTAEIYHVQSLISELGKTDLADQLQKVISKYGRWSYEEGTKKIDALVDGAGLTKTLQLPQSSIDLAAGYVGDQIKTIPAQLLNDVSKQITLSYLGQRSPQEIMRRISERFNVSMSRAETIVRTENKKLQNFGAEARIKEAAQNGKKLGLKSLRYWIHSSGAPLPGAGEEAFAKGKFRAGYDPRPHHKAMHGTAVEVDAKFHLVNPATSEAWFIEGPHDAALPASEVVNCYCDRALRIDRESVSLLPQPAKAAQKAPQAPEPEAPTIAPPPEPIAAPRAPQPRKTGTGLSAPIAPVTPDTPASLSKPWGKPFDLDALKKVDLLTAEPSWAPAKNAWWKERSFGAVIFDDDGRVLLREPTGHFGGYSWTFAKGGLANSKEHPIDAALREVGEETGYSGQVVGLVPGSHKGDASKSQYFLMRAGTHNPATMDAETSGLRWVTPAEAEELIGQSKNTRGRKRDLGVLQAAVAEHAKILSGEQTYAHLFGETQSIVPPAAPAASPAVSGFPETIGALKVVKKLGGTTGAQLVEDPATGKQYVMKRGASPEHLREEMNADAAYQALGVKVPAFKMYMDGKAPVKLAEYIPESRTLASLLKNGKKAEINAVISKLSDDFVKDALLGNWDVIGLESDNILIDKGGTPWRIDNGGSLRYRAQGAKKAAAEFGADVSELASMRDAKRNAATARVFASLTDKDIDEQIPRILARKDALLASLPAELRPAVEARLHSLEQRLSPSWFTDDEVRAIANARVLGRTYLGDASDIEDNSVLIWQESRNGKTVMKARLKLTKEGAGRLPADITKAAAAQTQKDTDQYWIPILDAVKTVNHHVKDGAYNMEKLNALKAIKKQLTQLNPKGDANLQAMKSHYLDIISKTELAAASKLATGTVSQYEPKAVPAKTVQPAQPDITVVKETWSLKAKERRKGYATEKDMGIYSISDTIKITTSDGIIMRHVPITNQQVYALRGLVELELESDVTKASLEKLLSGLSTLGIDPRPASRADLEVAYIAKNLNLNAGHMTAQQRNEWRAMLAAKQDPLEKAKVLRAWAKSKIKLDIPEGVDLAGSANAYGYGWKNWYRADLSPESIEKQMSKYVLAHHTQASLPQLIESFLNEGGQVTNTTERLRVGIPIAEGMSPGSDLQTGGADYFFTRIAPRASGRGQLEFKIRNLARLDAWSFSGDRFGDVRYGADNASGGRKDADTVRKSRINEYVDVASRGDNETIFKHGLSLIDDIDTIRSSSAKQRDELIRIFKKHGYDRLPDGRAIEMVIV